MKGNPKKKSVRKIIFIDQEDSCLREYKITSLPLSEASILAGSMEFYHDPEPCMIHRGAVMNRYYMEFDLWIDRLQNKENIMPLDVIPGLLLSYLEPWVLIDVAKSMASAHFVRDFHKHVLTVVAGVVLTQVNDLHGLNLQTARGTGSGKLPVPLADVIGQKAPHCLARKLYFVGSVFKKTLHFLRTASMLSCTAALEQPQRLAISE